MLSIPLSFFFMAVDLVFWFCLFVLFLLVVGLCGYFYVVWFGREIRGVWVGVFLPSFFFYFLLWLVWMVFLIFFYVCFCRLGVLFKAFKRLC